MTYREQTKEIRIGNRVIGGGNPILLQSMTNTDTRDVSATVDQMLRHSRRSKREFISR